MYVNTLLENFLNLPKEDQMQVMANLRALLVRRGVIKVYGSVGGGALDEIASVFVRNGFDIHQET